MSWPWDVQTPFLWPSKAGPSKAWSPNIKTATVFTTDTTIGQYPGTAE